MTEQTITLSWVEQNAIYYLLDIENKKAIAICKNIDGNWQEGYTFKREFVSGTQDSDYKWSGYEWMFEYTKVDANWIINQMCGKNYDITKDFNRAKNLAYQHVK